MSKEDKILNKWKNKIPPKCSKEDVFRILDYYNFQTRMSGKGGSHVIVTHPEIKNNLKKFQAFFGKDAVNCNGEFTVVLTKGRKVKKIYVTRILKIYEAIQVVQSLQD